jgi:hypothetical protein
MKWIVLEEDPQADDYVAVIVTEEDRVLTVESQPCTIYKSSEEALLRARYLREQFKVSSVRIFYVAASPIII